MILGNVVRFSLLGWSSIGPAKWVIRIGYRLDLSLLRVTFRPTMLGSTSGEIRVWVSFGSTMFRSGEVRVRVTYRFHARVRMGSVRVEFKSGLLRVVYSSPCSDSV